MIVASPTLINKIDFKRTVKTSDHYRRTSNLKQARSKYKLHLKGIWSKFERN